jgi:hypothetical protein
MSARPDRRPPVRPHRVGTAWSRRRQVEGGSACCGAQKQLDHEYVAPFASDSAVAKVQAHLTKPVPRSETAAGLVMCSISSRVARTSTRGRPLGSGRSSRCSACPGCMGRHRRSPSSRPGLGCVQAPASVSPGASGRVPALGRRARRSSKRQCARFPLGRTATWTAGQLVVGRLAMS